MASGLRILAVAALLALSPSVQAALMGTMDEPDTTIASNTVIDIVEHAGGIWMATGQGLNFSLDGGQTWLLYNAGNGLKRDDVSALRSFKGRLWVATAYTQIVGGTQVTYSDTLQYTEDDGQTFHTVDLGQTGATVPFAFGAQKTVYDVAAGSAQGDDWAFTANFAGGFIGSRDGGQSWRRLYASPQDSTAFSQFYTNPNYDGDLPYRMRAFSCAADTTHGDSMFVWAGSADGVLQYVYAPAENKPNSKWIADVEFCSDCLPGDTTVVFIGGDGGVTRASTKGQTFHAAFVDNGLPGAFVSDLHAFAGLLFAATWESRSGNAAGLAVSNDGGESYSEIDAFVPYTGPTERIHEIIDMQGRLYVAMETEGLWVSADTGDTWARIFVDSSNTAAANRRNVVWGLEALADTLRVGTDSGLVTLYMAGNGDIDSSRFDRFPETPFESGSRVIDIFTQVFTDTLGDYDSSAIWTINRALTAGGAPAVYRGSRLLELPPPSDTTFQWEVFQPNVLTNDIEFFGDTVLAMGHAGMRYSTDGGNPSILYYVRDSTSAVRFDSDTITVMAALGDTAFVGSNNGFAITHAIDSTFTGTHYKVFRPNLDSLAADFVLQHTPLSSRLGITGSFIPAMGLQTVEGEEFARIWLACQPGAGNIPGEAGISVGRFLEVDTTGQAALVWDSVLHGESAWNFAFDSDSGRVFVAGDIAGVLMCHNENLHVWDTLAVVDTTGSYLIDPGTAVYAVAVIGNELWIGSDQATVVMDLETLISKRSLYYIDSSSSADEVYAYPVPIRLSAGDAAEFHFTVEKTARITIEIFDAAMNLVRRVVDNEEFSPGVYQGRQTGVNRWDGHNGKGDKVAVGVYYFKVEYSTGEVRWGKLAVIP